MVMHKINTQMNKIGILLITFIRDDLLTGTYHSIIKHWNDYELFIGDQSPSSEKVTYFKKYNYIKLPFDCGLSFGRNELVKRAHETGRKYVLITSDSIQFIDKYDFSPIIDFMRYHPRVGIVGFKLKERIPWECTLDIKDGGFYFGSARKNYETINHKGINFLRCDIVKNIFLAKTECLLHNKWDDDLKLAEHPSYFYNLKNNPKSFTKEYGTDVFQPYQVYFTDHIKFNYVDYKPKEYLRYRKRMYSEFRQKAMKKYNLTKWHIYSPELKTEFNEWRSKR